MDNHCQHGVNTDNVLCMLCEKLDEARYDGLDYCSYCDTDYDQDFGCECVDQWGEEE